MSTATLLRPGDTLGGFRIDDVIGIGGMAIVYRAEQISLGRAVALKVLSTRLTRDEVFCERFRREGMHAATLEHPNIVPVYDSGEQDGLLYLAMRLVEGTNLAELIQTRGVTADQTIELLRPIASALDTAHAAGLIHRDVKPQNVLITSQGHPYLADFGVAKGSNTAGLTATGGFVGSVNYASPEQIKGLTLTPASDVYALTAVLYQCLTGHVPYPRETDAGVMHAHLADPPPTLPTLTGVDSDFHTVFARGMAKDPGARYGHAGDMITAAAVAVGRMPGSRRQAVPAFPDESAETASPGAAAATGDGAAVIGAIGAAVGGAAAGHVATGAAGAPAGGTEVVSAAELGAIREAESASLTRADRRRPPAPEPESEPEPVSWLRRRPVLAGAAAAAAVAAAVLALVLLVGGGGGHAGSTHHGVGSQLAGHAAADSTPLLAAHAQTGTSASHPAQAHASRSQAHAAERHRHRGARGASAEARHAKHGDGGSRSRAAKARGAKPATSRPAARQPSRTSTPAAAEPAPSAPAASEPAQGASPPSAPAPSASPQSAPAPSAPAPSAHPPSAPAPAHHSEPPQVVVSAPK
ncbi:MAG TPA: serine/threonine-protein kinase [Solirubrobacteraceae bacterium]|nr:serine/threonine-protein kinase [Solirubrobacteraceae bacterium]